MVEKIIINPEEVRAYGNIIEMKEDTDFTLYESTLETSTDTIGGQTVPVFELNPDVGELTVLTLATSSATVVLDGSVTLTATLKDEDNTPINAATITFKDGNTTLGTGTTNSSGVATYTYTATSTGSHTLEASFSGDSTYASSNANTNVTVLDHSYTLAFDADSYTAISGSATLGLTLLDNNVPVSGATVTVSGSDSSLYTGITNSSGIASVTVNNISSQTTFTATYSNVSTQCTVTVSSYIFYDAGSASGVSNYSQATHLEGSTDPPFSITYDSNEGAYYSQSESVCCITALTGFTDDFKLEVDVKRTEANTWCGLWYIQSTGNGFFYGGYVSTWQGHYYQNNSWKGSIRGGGTSNANTWYHLKLVKEDTSITINCYDSTGETLLKSATRTYTDSTNQFCIHINGYFKNIKAEPL